MFNYNGFMQKLATSEKIDAMKDNYLSSQERYQSYNKIFSYIN